MLSIDGTIAFNDMKSEILREEKKIRGSQISNFENILIFHHIRFFSLGFKGGGGGDKICREVHG